MRAIVLLSGGLDSAVTFLIAKKELGFNEIYALTFDYGQRHRVEIENAKKLAEKYSAKKHIILNLPLNQIGGSALTDINIEVPEGKVDRVEIPVTYVPARNLIFLSYATAIAEVNNIFDIFIGVNFIDYSGYPDCRPEFIKSFENTINVGTKAGVEGNKFKIHTPLIKMTKKEIILKGKELGLDFNLTHSCYNPDKNGNPCGKCDSCVLIIKCFKEAGLDPILWNHITIDIEKD